MPLVADITGVILAGGKSTRFGANKALVPFQDVPMIERVLNIFRSVFEDVMIVTNRPEDYAHLGVPVVRDLEPDQGPMGGIVTAFANTPNDRILAVACDMPLLDAGVLRAVAAASEGFDACVPVHDGIREYMMAVYSRRLAHRMHCCLSEGNGALRDFCEKLTSITWFPVTGDTWFNVNTKKDLDYLEKNHAH